VVEVLEAAHQSLLNKGQPVELSSLRLSKPNPSKRKTRAKSVR
jgi:hypothetical protein